MADRGSFKARVRFWKPERQGRLAVVDVPPDVAQMLGGLKQMRVRGSLNGADYTSNTMPGGGGRLCLSVSKQMLKDAGLSVGDEATFEIERIERA